MTRFTTGSDGTFLNMLSTRKVSGGHIYYFVNRKGIQGTFFKLYSTEETCGEHFVYLLATGRVSNTSFFTFHLLEGHPEGTVLLFYNRKCI